MPNVMLGSTAVIAMRGANASRQLIAGVSQRGKSFSTGTSFAREAVARTRQFRGLGQGQTSRSRCGCAACNPLSRFGATVPSLVTTTYCTGRYYSGSAGPVVSSGKPIKRVLTNDGPIGSKYGSLPGLFEQNRNWSESEIKSKPDFFERLAKQQNPKYLWIGCSDSRVPANQVVGLAPGELFVHRNVANVVVHTDLNCLSVMQFAVEYLKVEHIIVCGHYGCGGVLGALRGSRLGLIDNWLRHIVDVREKHQKTIDSLAGLEDEQHDLLCELNAIEQAVNVAQTSIVRDAWRRGQPLQIHSWIYGLDDGKLKDLGFHVKTPSEVKSTYELVSTRYSL